MSKIRLTESQLHKVIKESVNKILKELKGSTIQRAYNSALDQGRNDQAEHIADMYDDPNNVYQNRLAFNDGYQRYKTSINRNGTNGEGNLTDKHHAEYPLGSIVDSWDDYYHSADYPKNSFSGRRLSSTKRGLFPNPNIDSKEFRKKIRHINKEIGF